MYFIRHLPTRTLYGTIVNDRMAITAFKHKADAIYVGDCIATYKQANHHFPLPSKTLYVMGTETDKTSYVDELLWIDEIPATVSFMESLGMRGVDTLHIVDIIDWERDAAKPSVSGRNISILCPSLLLAETMTKDWNNVDGL